MQFIAPFCFIGFLSIEYCDRRLNRLLTATTLQQDLGICLNKPTEIISYPTCSTQRDWHDIAGKADGATRTRPPAARPGHVPHIPARSSPEPPPTTTTASGPLPTAPPSPLRVPMPAPAAAGQKWTQARPTDVASYATRPYSGRVTIDPVSATTTDSPPTFNTMPYRAFERQQVDESNATIIYVTIQTRQGRTPRKMSLGPTATSDVVRRAPVVTGRSESLPLDRAAQPGAVPRVQPMATASPVADPVAMPIMQADRDTL